MCAIAVVEQSGVDPNPPVDPTTNVTEETVKSYKHHPAANRVAVVDESVENEDERIPTTRPILRALIRTISTKTKSTLAL